MKKIPILFLIFLNGYFILQSQEIRRYSIEKYLRSLMTEQDITPALETIEYFNLNPIYLSKATPDDLTQLPTIDLLSARIILERYSSHPESSYYALLDSLNLSDIQKHIIQITTSREILPESTFSSNKFKYSALNEYRFEKVAGFEKKEFRGDAWDLKQKLFASVDNFEVYMQSNKNPGEIHLAEFFSGAVQYKNTNIQAIVGDYSITSGFGAILGSAFSFGKGSDYISGAYPYSAALKQNTSTITTVFFRGAAVRYSFDVSKSLRISLNPFVSNYDRSATIDALHNEATSLYSQSLFRTDSEIRKKNSLNEKALGNALVINWGNFTLGSNLLSLNYAKPITSSSSGTFQGKSGILYSFFSSMYFGKFIIGGEIAADNNKNLSKVLAAMYRTNSYSFAVNYRRHDTFFRSPFGSGFGEFSNPANEEGLYLGFSQKINEKSTIDAYIDLYSSLSRTYLVQMPVRGYDFSSQYIRQSETFGEIFAKIKYEQKTDGYKKNNAGNQIIVNSERLDLRLETEKEILKDLLLRLRLDYVNFDLNQNNTNESGVAGFAQITYSPFSDLRLAGRISLFSTPSYNSAVWHFEYRMPGSSQANALSGDGSRLLLQFVYKLQSSIDVYLSFVRYQKNNVTKLGSSWDAISGNVNNRLYSMIAIKL